MTSVEVYLASDEKVLHKGILGVEEAISLFQSHHWSGSVGRALVDGAFPTFSLARLETKARSHLNICGTEDGSFLIDGDLLFNKKFLGIIPTRQIQSLQFESASRSDIVSVIRNYYKLNDMDFWMWLQGLPSRAPINVV